MKYHFQRFVDALHKLKRARHHMENLWPIINEYVATLKPDFRFDEETGTNFLELEVPHPPEAIPPVLGDAVHNLSSALDCISSRIIAEATGNWNRRVYFPTHETLAELQRSFETQVERPCPCGSGTICRKGSNAVIREYAPEFERLLIDEFKPCKDQNSMIWAIRKLDNIDKHNYLITALGDVTVGGLNFHTVEGDSQQDCVYFLGSGTRTILGQSQHPFIIDSPGAVGAAVVFATGPLEGHQVLPWLAQAQNAVFEILKVMERTFGSLIEEPTDGAVVA